MLILTLRAAFCGGYGRVLSDHRCHVTVMRHLFCPPYAVLFLTHFMIQPTRFCLLIYRPRPALSFRARQRGTRLAVPVPTVAVPADHHLCMTTFAVENPAIVVAHPEAPTKGLYTRRAEARCSLRASNLGINLSRRSGGPGSQPGPPPLPDAQRAYLTLRSSSQRSCAFCRLITSTVGRFLSHRRGVGNL